MSIIRKRSASHKAFLPSNARENQYIMMKFPVTEALIRQFSTELNSSEPYQEFYQSLAATFFEVCQKFELKNCQFIANDKLARIRFSQEIHQWQTNQQILFHYNPSSHNLNKTFFDGKIKAKNITLLFLASGLDIRLNAAIMHAKVMKAINVLLSYINIAPSTVTIRDHQHITYDIFTKYKGSDNTQSHRLRTIPDRYQAQNLPIEHSCFEMNYAVVNIPVTNHLLNLVDLDLDAEDPYNPLYTFITDAFTQSAKRYNLSHGALIATGLVPIVRFSKHESTSIDGELQILGYNPDENPCGLSSRWNSVELIDDIQLVYIATKKNRTNYGYGQFLNQVEQSLKLVATELELSPQKDEVVMRFHQHIGYNLKD